MDLNKLHLLKRPSTLSPDTVDRSAFDLRLRRSLRRQLPIYKPFVAHLSRQNTEVCLPASASNYRVRARIGSNIRMKYQYAILDTGAGRNFIDLDEIHTSMRDQVFRANPLTVIDANRNQLKILGSIKLWISLGSKLSRKEFIVCKDFASPYILGCTYLSRTLKRHYPF